MFPNLLMIGRATLMISWRTWITLSLKKTLMSGLGMLATKKWENVGILKKKNRGVSTQIPLPFFTVFNMGDNKCFSGPKLQNKL